MLLRMLRGIPGFRPASIAWFARVPFQASKFEPPRYFSFGLVSSACEL
jgi:hypothetical protein